MYGKKEQIKKIAELLETTQIASETIYDAFCEMIVDGLTTEGKVKVGNIATFEVKDVPERTARNPKTGVMLTIAPKKKVVVRIASGLKAIINE